MIKKLLLFVVAAALSSCASSGPGAGVKAPTVTPKYTVFLKGEPEWKTMGDVERDLKGSGAKISGTTVDLKGGRISGSKIKHPSNQNDEQSIGIKIRIKGLTLRGGVVDDFPGGLISYAENVTFEKLTFLRGGEDFVSNGKDVAPGMKVIDCKFYGNKGSDKLVQGNDGRDLLVDGNLLSSAITGIRVQKKDAKFQGKTATISNNRFVGVDTAINAAGHVRVVVKGNTFEGVREKYKTDSDQVKFVEN